MQGLIIAVSAFASGVIGTALGAVAAVILTALVAIIGIAANILGADYNLVSEIAFGMFLGPHISFGPACCAVAYAYKKGYIEDSRDIFTPLIMLNKPDVIFVGGVIGIAGWYINTFAAQILGGKVDTVALTVALIMIISKKVFCGSVLGKLSAGEKRFALDAKCWLPWQTCATGYHMLLVGGSVGVLAGYLVLSMCRAAESFNNPALAEMSTIPIWALAIFSFLYMSTGRNIPVFHHVGLSGAYAAKAAYDLGAGDLAILWGLAFGLFSVYIGDWAGKLLDVHSEGYVDPPTVAVLVTSVITMSMIPCIAGVIRGAVPMALIPIIITIAFTAYGIICEKQNRESHPE
ncbi:MAG: acetyl-CoA acyltransferase [Lachnospiraceae bacterium]|nr:acetyl-CoA acyltransferase [Lachnospiraceae bacterium]